MSALLMRDDIDLAIAGERARQHEQWGEQNHPDGTGAWHLQKAAEIARLACDKATAEGTCTWTLILLEEVFEALAETDEQRLEQELVQALAVGKQWVEAIRRRRRA